jgi:hypothetical protein
MLFSTAGPCKRRRPDLRDCTGPDPPQVFFARGESLIMMFGETSYSRRRS